MKHEKEIRDELTAVGLDLTDLTKDEIQQFDNELDVSTGVVLDGIREILPQKAYEKHRKNHERQ